MTLFFLLWSAFFAVYSGLGAYLTGQRLYFVCFGINVLSTAIHLCFLLYGR
jgi:hypothetical protein